MTVILIDTVVLSLQFETPFRLSNKLKKPDNLTNMLQSYHLIGIYQLTQWAMFFL